jgi:hypothetical protein
VIPEHPPNAGYLYVSYDRSSGQTATPIAQMGGSVCGCSVTALYAGKRCRPEEEAAAAEAEE